MNMSQQNKFQIFLVGGWVRDHLLGIPSKDKDYVCECSFDELRSFLVGIGCVILFEKVPTLTMRVKLKSNEVVDFACCRKEGCYDGRTPAEVEPATLLEDLARRDFTVNAMAMEVNENFEPVGKIIDPFNGQADLKTMNLRFVGNPKDRLEEDGLRWIRAIRFCITKGFKMSQDTIIAFHTVKDSVLDKVSVERIRDELYLCCKHDTLETMHWLTEIPPFWMKDGLWMVPTLEEK